MFCPNCKAEYRVGFTECSDCQVPLVEKLPDDSADAKARAVVDASNVVKLWEGSDAGAFEALGAELKAANIRHEDLQGAGRLWGGGSLYPFAIWIEKTDEEAAREILANVCGEADASNAEGADDSSRGAEGENAGQGTELEEEDLGAEPPPDDGVEDFHPDDATLEVWSGEDKQMADYLKMSLNENGIGCVVAEDGGKRKVVVLPAAELRAKEIVRQVVDATPPQ
jgi:hypothetical protein